MTTENQAPAETEAKTPSTGTTPIVEARQASTTKAKAEEKIPDAAAKAKAPAKRSVTRKPRAVKTTAGQTTTKKPATRKTYTRKTGTQKTAAVKPGIAKTTRPRKTTKPAAAAKPAAARTRNAAASSARPQDYAKDMNTMYENSLKQMQDLLSEFQGGFGDLPLANEEVSKLMEASRDATVSGMSELNKELNAFTQARMSECWETAREVMGSKSVPEAFEVQSKYVQDAFKAYTEEFQKLNSIATDVTQKAFAPMSNGFADSFARMFGGKAA